MDKVWKSSNISLKTKLKLYDSISSNIYIIVWQRILERPQGNRGEDQKI